MIISNPLLSIVIPTYNRSTFISEFLHYHYTQIIKYNIEVFVLDNNSEDQTSEIVKEWNKKSELIKYCKNDVNLGGVKNVQKAFAIPTTEYFWVLGDTYKIPQNGILKSLEIINTKQPDFIIFNLANRGPIEERLYTDKNQVLNDLGAVCSCLSVTIFKRSRIQDISKISLLDYSVYPHTLILFHSLSNTKNFKLLWLGDKNIEGLAVNGVVKNSWIFSKDVFEIGLRNWRNTVMSLPDSYTKSSKQKAIIDEFKIVIVDSRFSYFRKQNIFNLRVYRKYKYELSLCENINMNKIFLIACSPIFLFQVFDFILGSQSILRKCVRFFKKFAFR